jgi:hypothetical protein
VDVISLREAAAALGVTPAALRMAIRRGRLHANKWGRDWFLTSQQLDQELIRRGKPPRGKA